MDIMLSPIETSEGRSVIATIRDITERKQAEEALRKAHEERALLAERTAAVSALETRSRQQKAISDLSQHALEGLDLTTCWRKRYSCVQEILGRRVLQDAGAVAGSEVTAVCAPGPAGKGVKSEKVALPTGPKSQAGYALLSSSPVIVEDLRTEKRFRASPLLLEHGAVSGISVIIHGRARPYGVLEAHTTRQRNFTPDDIHFLQSVASILAAAIERRGVGGRVAEYQQSRAKADGPGFARWALSATCWNRIQEFGACPAVDRVILLRKPRRRPSARLLRDVTREARNAGSRFVTGAPGSKWPDVGPGNIKPRIRRNYSISSATSPASSAGADDG